MSLGTAIQLSESSVFFGSQCPRVCPKYSVHHCTGTATVSVLRCAPGCQGPAERRSRRRSAPACPPAVGSDVEVGAAGVAAAGARLAGAWIRCGSGHVHLHRRHRPPLGPCRPHLDTVKSPPLLSSFRHTLLCTRRSEHSPTVRREKARPCDAARRIKSAALFLNHFLIIIIIVAVVPQASPRPPTPLNAPLTSSLWPSAASCLELQLNPRRRSLARLIDVDQASRAIYQWT
ncbi:hypothetical protein ACCO45_004664 [Purpureocillium lilacinum]|uniref:Uncharacterized protein n=1 Tax=Purpureocillium lilacinum TaxID=33203 RepID=A0ACC4DTX2_PURLI